LNYCRGTLSIIAAASPTSASAAWFGRSSIYCTHAEYALEHSVHDMLDLLARLDRNRAIWG
jgi:hypothetical protein